MAQLAIKGHSTRGKEVIELLEMLGGHNVSNLLGNKSDYIYFITDSGYIGCRDTKYILTIYYISTNCFTLEEFLEKYPFKVGDNVIAYAEECLAQFTIRDIRWNYKLNRVEYKICSSWCDTSLIQPYKEEIMEDENFGECIEKTIQECLFGKEETTKESANKAIFEGNAQSCNIMNDIIKKAMEKIKIDIPEGYGFFGIDDNNKIVLTKIQPKYPKTYAECCVVLNCKADHFFTDFSHEGCDIEISDYEYKIDDLLQNFRKLIYCRDAYWKIAGDEMGLGKPWKPDWNTIEDKYTLYTSRDIIVPGQGRITNSILAFPTEEMRDAFYENFKDLIEHCKELL